MKNVIIMVSMISLAIIFVVLLITFSNDAIDQERYESEFQSSDPMSDIDLNLSIVTSEVNFWERVEALNNKKKNVVIVTDEAGNPVTDENGKQVTAGTGDDENISLSEYEINENGESPVTEMPENEIQEVTGETAKHKKLR